MGELTSRKDKKKGQKEMIKAMTLEEAKEDTREQLSLYYDSETIEDLVNRMVAVARPGVVLVSTETAGLCEMWV